MCHKTINGHPAARLHAVVAPTSASVVRFGINMFENRCDQWLTTVQLWSSLIVHEELG